jgi:outer membrane protein assembly factor BamB
MVHNMTTQVRIERICLLFAAAMALLLTAADWPQFRGPNGAAVSNETGLPTTWSSDSNVAWKTELPGFGASSPIVHDGRVYLTCYTGYALDEDDPGDPGKLTRHVACFDLASGRQLWIADFASLGSEQPYQGFLQLHGYASSTLATDGESLFAFFGRDGVVALTMDGKPKWQTSVGTGTDGWGSATSPVLFENLVIVNASVESDSLVALDKQSGRQVWKADGMARSWSTPALVETSAGETELVVSVQDQILGFDPASGKQLWNCAGIPDYICPSVLAHDGVVYAIGGRRAMAIAIKAGGRGDVTDSHRLWEIREGSNVTSPVYYGDYLYWVNDRGVAYCVDPEAGEVVYEERLSPSAGKIYASAVAAGGKLYVVSRDKGTYVLAAAPEFELAAYNEPLDESIFNGSPAVVDGKLLLRSDKYLYCLAE